MKLLKKQKYLRTGGLMAYIVLLNTVCPLSTDMYTPSLPAIAEEYGVSATETNSTLYLYFLFLAIGILLIGPISDKFGRKKVLIASCFCYSVSAFLCFLSPSLTMLVISRCLQGLAAGGMLAVMTAVIKDSFKGHSRAVMLSLSQALGTLAPIIAPLLGAVVVEFVSWHYIFLILTVVGLFMTILAFIFEESIPEEERITESIFVSYKGLKTVLKNKSFTMILLSLACFCAPFMAYLGVASYIYQDSFGCTPIEFSMFFALAASISVIGCAAPIFVSKNIYAKKLIKLLSLVMALGLMGSCLVLFAGHKGVIFFFVSFMIYMVSQSFAKPFLVDIILRQHKGNTGSASSVLNFTLNVMGSLGMIIGSLPWMDYIFGLGITMLVFVIIAIAFWVHVLTSKKFVFKVKE